MRNSIAECPIDDPSVEAKVAALDALVASLDNGSLQPSPYAPPAPAVSPAQRPRYSGCSPTIRAVAESICAANDHCKISDGEASPNNHQGRATLGVDAAAPEATALNVSPPAQPTKTTASTPTRLHVPANQNLPAWRSLNERRKIAAALDGLEEAQAHAFRLTFSPNKDRKLRADAAAGHDILQAINDAIAASFRRRKLKAPAIVFAIEEQPGDGRLHIHGVVEAVSADRDMIREAFTAAGGGAVYSGHASGNSFWLANDPVKGARRYLRYARKDEARVMRRLGIDRVVFMNDRARKIGQNFYTARRAAGTPQKRAGTIPARRDSESSDATQRPSVAVSEAHCPAGTTTAPAMISQSLMIATRNTNSQRILTIYNTPELIHKAVAQSNLKRKKKMHPEIYINDYVYEVLADFTRVALKIIDDMPADERRRDCATLADSFMVFAGKGYDREALAEALFEFSPLITGDYDIRDVRWLLGSTAGIYPERARTLEIAA